MQILIKLLTIGSSLFLLNACTSLEDFQKMTPQTRAHKTCNNNVTVKHYKSQTYHLTNEINEIDELLLKGYKTHENCTTITYERTDKDKPVNSIKKICTEVIIPLNDHVYESEKNRRAELALQLENAKDKKQSNFDKCFDQVLSMSVEQAYNRFDN
jgi:hypothetical protein